MEPQTQPLVSVVTPVYNGERYLAEAIGSILSQTYTHWEYIIVNNQSTDRSLEIAQQYARRDSRIRVYTNPEFLGMLQNWNNALRQISPESTYCKVLHADDWLFPDCITQMVCLAEAHPSVGIVGAYRLHGSKVDLDGLPYPSTVVPGRDLCRAALMKGLYVFGSPTSTLFRAKQVRSRTPFYNEANLHADTEVCYDILQHADFGFIHQVLTYTRTHDEQVSSFAQRMNTYALGNLRALVTYGPVYLSHAEYEQHLRLRLDQYYDFLGFNVLRRRDKKFWDYHREGLRHLGYRLSEVRLARIVCAKLLDRILNPKRTIEGRMHVLAMKKQQVG